MGDRTNKDASYLQAVQQSKYGLGDRRSMDQAIQFTGVNLRKRKIIANRCGNIDWVPYTPHPEGPAYEIPYDPVTEAFIGTRDQGSVFPFHDTPGADRVTLGDARDALGAQDAKYSASIQSSSLDEVTTPAKVDVNTVIGTGEKSQAAPARARVCAE